MKLTQGPIAEWLRPWASLWLTIHLFALVACLAANRRTSVLGSRLVRLLAPHSVVLHQDYGNVPLGMTYGDEIDCDHLLELHLVSRDLASSDLAGSDLNSSDLNSSDLNSSDLNSNVSEAAEWVTVDAPTLVPLLDRRWKNFKQMLAAAAHEKNEEVVHLCFEHAIGQQPLESQRRVDAIRLRRRPTVALASHALVARGELPESELALVTLYECSVVRLSGDRIKLVPVLEATRRAKSLQSLRGADDGQR